MSDEQPTVEGRRSSRKTSGDKRGEALERIKALRTGGRRSTENGGLQVKIDEPIYDVVEDDEYNDIVAKRREAARGFIVDDDGLGYGDEGQEEDWSVAGVLSSDESEDENEKPKNKKKASEKKQQIAKKPSAALTAAAALMGKQRISSMFTSSVFKRDDKTRNLSCDSIVDDVIAEFAPDEADREQRRRGNSNSLHASRNSTANSNLFNVKNEKPVADNVDFMIRQEVKSVNVQNGEFISDGLPKISMDEGNKSIKNIQNSEVLDAEVEAEKAVESDDLSTVVKGDNDAIVNCAEVKSEPLVENKVFALNAKINEEKNPGFSATAEWQALRNAGSGDSNCNEPGAKLVDTEEKTDFELDSDGSLPFFILDAHEELYGTNAGNIYLFGKVKAGGTYHSCCIVVKNMQRCVYAVPNGSVFCSDTISKLSRDVEESQISPSAFLSQLHEMASGLKAECRNKLLEHNISSFSMAPVKRNYAFERSDVPRGENFVLKINYPFKDPQLPSDLRGENFSSLLGTHSSAMELFLIKRKIKGPSWLSISKFSSCHIPQRVSWCKFEVIVDSPKDILISTSSKNVAEIPPVVVAAINLKTIINQKQNINEIVSASVICCQSAKEITRLPIKFLLLFIAVSFLFHHCSCLKIGETCTDNNCDEGLICSTCPANGNTRSRCTRIRPIIPTTKVKGLPFNKYSWLTTHNSFAISGSKSSTGSDILTPTNQEDSITSQLENGVRGLMLDMYDFSDDIWLCHSFGGKCYNVTAFQPAINSLREIQGFLEKNPSEVVTIFIEDYVSSPKGLSKVFNSSGLNKYLFPVSRMPQKGEDWPTVDDMVKQNQRLVVFTSKSSKEASEGIAYEWRYVVENQYGKAGMTVGSCSSRSESSAMSTSSVSLVLQNYFPENPNKTDSCLDNSAPLVSMTKTCFEASGKRWPNFIAVDFYQKSDGGGASEVVDGANGQLACNCSSIAYCKGNGSSLKCEVPMLAPPPPAQAATTGTSQDGKNNSHSNRSKPLHWLFGTIFVAILFMHA